MPMSFPNLTSLKNRAKQRGFRDIESNESEDQYRTSFADFMQSVDFVESMEIRAKVGWDEFEPHLKQKYSQRKEYLKGGEYYNLVAADENNYNLRSLCQNCGEPFGEHALDYSCPILSK
jgi:hypothetical protein